MSVYCEDADCCCGTKVFREEVMSALGLCTRRVKTGDEGIFEGVANRDVLISFNPEVEWENDSASRLVASKFGGNDE